MKYGVKIANKIKSKEVDEIEHSLHYVLPLKVVQNVQQPSKEAWIPTSLFSTTHFWPIQRETLWIVNHPKGFKV